MNFLTTATDTELRTLLARKREFIQQAWADGASNTALRAEAEANLLEGELGRRSIERFWAGSASQAIMDDYAAGNVVDVVLD